MRALTWFTFHPWKFSVPYDGHICQHRWGLVRGFWTAKLAAYSLYFFIKLARRWITSPMVTACCAEAIFTVTLVAQVLFVRDENLAIWDFIAFPVIARVFGT